MWCNCWKRVMETKKETHVSCREECVDHCHDDWSSHSFLPARRAEGLGGCFKNIHFILCKIVKHLDFLLLIRGTMKGIPFHSALLKSWNATWRIHTIWLRKMNKTKLHLEVSIQTHGLWLQLWRGPSWSLWISTPPQPRPSKRSRPPQHPGRFFAFIWLK